MPAQCLKVLMLDTIYGSTNCNELVVIKLCWLHFREQLTDLVHTLK